MSLTVPMLSYPVVIASDLTLGIDFTSVTDEDVTLAAGTYYVQGDDASTDLLKVLEDALNTNSRGANFTVSLNTSALKVLITGTGQAVTEIEVVGGADVLKALGYTLTTGIFITFAGAFASAPYRPAAVWCPSEEDHAGIPTQTDAIVGQMGDDGDGVIDVYSGRTVWEHRFYEVYPPLVRSHYASNATMVGDVRSPSLSSGDTNAALDGWIRRLQTLTNGATPTLRYTPDVTTLGTYRSVRLGAVNLYGSVTPWIASTNEAPRHHELRFELIEVE